jgi:hypothetical protein
MSYERSLTAVAAAMFALLGALPAHAQTAAPAAASAAASRTVVTRADQLPRRTYALPKLPSELLEAPLADLMPLAQALERDARADLAAFEIRDDAALRAMHGLLMNVAMLRADRAGVAREAARLRELQDKPGPRLTTGLAAEAVAEARAAGGDPAAQSARVRASLEPKLAALPWADVQDAIKAAKGQFELATPQLVIGGFRSQIDVAARNAGMTVDATLAAAIVNSRVAIEQVLPLREALAAAYGAVVARHAASQPAKPDRWSERLAALPADAKASPVVVGIWDSGVDLALFRPAPARGMAFAEDGTPSTDLLRPLGEAQSRWPELRGTVKGAMDLQAALDTDEARRLRQTIAGLKAEQAQTFQEDLSLAGLYVHGTHVAGIAVDGNPFASVYTVTMLYSHKAIPPRPTEERSIRTAANYQRIVDGLKAAKVRVVNMSWRYGPNFYELALGFHGIGKDGEERKRIAQQLFARERDALRAAIASAPEILFVAGAGNENNSADFVEYIPAGLELPNLITAGAVDKAGEETAFSTFGKTVVVHANGFEVDSLVPGGERLKLSGTSMAAPQVTNLAAKLFALDPRLNALQVKALILDHAERRGRINLIHPKATLAAAARARGG